MSFGRTILLVLIALLNFHRIDGQITPISQGMLGKNIPDFSILTVNQGEFKTEKSAEIKGIIIVFTCNHCPFAKLYTDRLNNLHSKYSQLGIPLLAINSMDSIQYEDESFLAMSERAKSKKYVFPYAQDHNQALGKLFKAEHTPEVFILWKDGNNWTIKYTGSIDDNGENPELAVPFVANALDQLLENKTVTQPITESFGCRIHYRIP